MLGPLRDTSAHCALSLGVDTTPSSVTMPCFYPPPPPAPTTPPPPPPPPPPLHPLLSKCLALFVIVLHSICVNIRLHTFVATKDVFCRDKRMLIATKLYLLRQKKVRQKLCFATNISRDKHNIDKYFCRDKRRALSRQKLYFRQLLPMIREKGDGVGREAGWGERERN